MTALQLLDRAQSRPTKDCLEAEGGGDGGIFRISKRALLKLASPSYPIKLTYADMTATDDAIICSPYSTSVVVLLGSLI